MTDEAMSPLRRRMIEDMTIRKLAPKTQQGGIGQQVQRSSGSTPHDRVTIPQICSSRSLALDWPRQSALRYPAVLSNRANTFRVRRQPAPIHAPLRSRTTSAIAPPTISHSARGTQIPITNAAPPDVSLPAGSKIGFDQRFASLLYSAIARCRSSYSSQGMRQICSRAARCSLAFARSPWARWASPRCSCALRCRGLRVRAC